jgi:hypothetical protein
MAKSSSFGHTWISSLSGFEFQVASCEFRVFDSRVSCASRANRSWSISGCAAGTRRSAATWQSTAPGELPVRILNLPPVLVRSSFCKLRMADGAGPVASKLSPYEATHGTRTLRPCHRRSSGPLPQPASGSRNQAREDLCPCWERPRRASWRTVED